MPLIILDAVHVHDGTTYQPNSVITVPTGVDTWLIGASKARAIVAGPASWAAGDYPAANLVSYNGVYYVNTSGATSSDVPGVASVWVAVSYLSSAPATGDFYINGIPVTISTAGSDGTIKRVAPEVVDDGIVTLAVES